MTIMMTFATTLTLHCLEYEQNEISGTKKLFRKIQQKIKRFSFFSLIYANYVLIMHDNEVLMRSIFLPYIRIDRGYPNCHLGQKW